MTRTWTNWSSGSTTATPCASSWWRTAYPTQSSLSKSRIAQTEFGGAISQLALATIANACLNLLNSPLEAKGWSVVIRAWALLSGSSGGLGFGTTSIVLDHSIFRTSTAVRETIKAVGLLLEASGLWPRNFARSTEGCRFPLSSNAALLTRYPPSRRLWAHSECLFGPARCGTGLHCHKRGYYRTPMTSSLAMPITCGGYPTL